MYGKDKHLDDARWPLALFRWRAAEYESQAAASLEQPQMDLAGQEFQSELDMDSFLKLSSAGDHLKEAREGESPLNRLLITCLPW